MEGSMAERIIDGALKIISDPKRWTRWAEAKERRGGCCGTYDDRAVRFCAQGAIRRTAYELLGAKRGKHLVRALAVVRAVNPDFVIVNGGYDGRRKVIAIFEQALKNLRA